MLLSSGKLPEDDARHLYEVKCDGYRAVVYLDKGKLRLLTRNDNDLAGKLPELAGLAQAARRRRLVLDAELITPGDDGRPDFDRLQLRMKGNGTAPVCLQLFDLMYLDGERTTQLPLEARKRRLGELGLRGPNWTTVSYSVGNGAALLAASREQRLEGLVAKRLGSRYTPGKRSDDWVKIKNWDVSTLIVGGWEPAGDNAIHGLLLGAFDGDQLVYRGMLETGVGARLLPALHHIERSTSPFANRVPRRGRYVEPRLVADVQHLAGSAGMRHALLLSVRVRG
jgi:bifunctional non-homologous end joining protein LigD